MSIQLEVIDVFKGNEAKDTITIWNGTDFDCNGIFSMAANKMGQINDTIVVGLPEITAENIENSWDVVGDYRRPDYFCKTPLLEVSNDSVVGLVKTNVTSALSYDDFKSLWGAFSGFDCSNIIAVREFSIESNFNISSLNERLDVSTTSNEPYVVHLIDITGRAVNLGKYVGSNSIPVESVHPEVSMIKVFSGGQAFVKKMFMH